MGRAPMLVLNSKTERSEGASKIQSNNVNAAKAVGDLIRTCLGPKAMLKMLMDPMGGIVMTNDGNAILREITVQNPAAKMLIEIARTQDEEVGDGTTSVVVLAAEIMSLSLPFLKDKMHPTTIIEAYRQCLDFMIETMKDKLSVAVDVDANEAVEKILRSCVNASNEKWGAFLSEFAVKAVKQVATFENGKAKVDVKRYIKVEKIPGGLIEDSKVLNGVMFNKDVVHPKMPRRLEKPRVVLLDCGLEYKKGESVTNMEFSQATDFSAALQMEEEQVKQMVAEVLRVKPTLLITEKGVSELASYLLAKEGVAVIRRVKKTDNNRIAKAVGATIVHRPEELKEEDVGTKCGLFEISKIGDEYFTFLTECENPKACTVMLRGPSKDVLNEIERNLNDALQVARNLMQEPRIVYGGGAVEVALAKAIAEKAEEIQGEIQWPFKAIGQALEVIPRILVANCGESTIRATTSLKAKHAEGPDNHSYGIDGMTGQVRDMKEAGVFDPFVVRMQVYKSAVETAMMLLRIDDIVSGVKKASDLTDA